MSQMVIEGEDDPEGELLERVRSIVGPTVPIVCAYDLHLHLTPRMCARTASTPAPREAQLLCCLASGAREALVKDISREAERRCTAARARFRTRVDPTDVRANSLPTTP